MTDNKKTRNDLGYKEDR